MTPIHVPLQSSHKGQNGRLLLIGGSSLFHAASTWSLLVASRIVDLVHFASVPENNELIRMAKHEFRNGIVIERNDIENYIKEDDCILIGPGMMRAEDTQVQRSKINVQNLHDVEKIQDEGVETAALTNYLLKKYSKKQWVIDAGALQMMDVSLIPKNAILTPHHGEFVSLFKRAEVVNENLDPSSVSIAHSTSDISLRESEVGQNFIHSSRADLVKVEWFAKKYSCIVLLKGEKDIVSDGEKTKIITGGNAGMTKGGTGDVLAGLIAALACKNDPFVATEIGSRINKMAGDALYKTVGPFFNATDLANQIPIELNNYIHE